MSLTRKFYVYILASKSRRLYIGMTNSLFHRILQHKSGEFGGFAAKYQINRLVYFEAFRYVTNCSARETVLKKRSRAKKLKLVTDCNPTWEDLAADWATRSAPFAPAPSQSRFLTARSGS